MKLNFVIKVSLQIQTNNDLTILHQETTTVSRTKSDEQIIIIKRFKL